uniref:Uncharacterized protein n=1 Tax=Megaselia scalaris TaxID=36166 RepID=T1H1H1_MEGSC
MHIGILKIMLIKSVSIKSEFRSLCSWVL